ncbi:regulator of G-protein signaling domain-containing protein [Azospirillum canadense]|uniref:hypothetical protein n=1 Tax=Azospirillum canadense TaxID=403962 RepID=UPI002227FB47|nr:hypothetical protein [Azospirillum canadense]MCW2240675.1 hypothetical protein [Azospirillum canadense]
MIGKTYPSALTNKSWQKAKGLLAKAAPESGLGAALAKCEKSFPGDYVARFNGLVALVKKYEDAKDEIRKSECKKDHATLKSEGKALAGELQAYRTDVVAAKKVAERTALAYKALKTIPASATKAASDVAAALTEEIGKIDDTRDTIKIADAGVQAVEGHRLRIATIRLKDIPPQPTTVKQVAKIMNHAYWGPIYLKKAKAMILMDLIGFLGAMSRLELNQDTYDTYVAPNAPKQINVGSVRKKFVATNASPNKDWSTAPWDALVNIQLNDFHQGITMLMTAEDLL